MIATIRYLNWDDEAEEGDRFGPANELKARIRHEEELPTEDEIEELYRELGFTVKVGAESVEEALSKVWNQLNRGPGGYHNGLDHSEERSACVGDVAEINGETWVCAKFGWEQVD